MFGNGNGNGKGLSSLYDMAQGTSAWSMMA